MKRLLALTSVFLFTFWAAEAQTRTKKKPKKKSAPVAQVEKKKPKPEPEVMPSDEPPPEGVFTEEEMTDSQVKKPPTSEWPGYAQ